MPVGEGRCGCGISEIVIAFQFRRAQHP